MASPGASVISPVDGKIVGITQTYRPEDDHYNGEFKSIHVQDESKYTYIMRYVIPKDGGGKELVQSGDSVK